MSKVFVKNDHVFYGEGVVAAVDFTADPIPKDGKEHEVHLGSIMGGIKLRMTFENAIGAYRVKSDGMIVMLNDMCVEYDPDSEPVPDVKVGDCVDCQPIPDSPPPTDPNSSTNYDVFVKRGSKC